MKRLVLLLMLLMVAVPAMGDITPSINNRFTYLNGYRWTGDVKDFILDWAQAIESAVESAEGTGSVFYVDSGVATEGDGTSWANAKDTLNEGIGLCTANRGDIIYVAQGHNEALIAADGVDADIAGITIIGVGTGSDRPRFDYDATGGEFVIGAASVRIVNLTFLPGINIVTHAIDIEIAGDWAVIENCEFLDGEAAATDEFVDTIQVGTTATNITVTGCKYFSTGTGTNTFVDLTTATIASPTVTGCNMYGAFAEAGIYGAATVPTNVLVTYNLVTNTTSGQLGIEFSGNATGECFGNLVFTDAIGTSYDTGVMNGGGGLWADSDSSDTTPVPWVTNETGVNRWGVTELAQMTGVLDASDVDYWQERTLTMTATAADDDLFDVDGGRILITGMVGLVSTEIGAGGNTLQLKLDADAVPDIDSSFTTAVDIDGDIVGTRYTFTAAAQSVLVPVSDTTGNSNLMAPWFCGEGMIEQDSQGSPAGAIVWYMTYKPLETGVTVTAQ